MSDITGILVINLLFFCINYIPNKMFWRLFILLHRVHSVPVTCTQVPGGPEVDCGKGSAISLRPQIVREQRFHTWLPVDTASILRLLLFSAATARCRRPDLNLLLFPSWTGSEIHTETKSRAIMSLNLELG